MKQFEGLLLVTDLDDTLLDRNKKISKENLEAIRYFTEQGGLFTFVTGRVPQGLGLVLPQLCPTIPIGCINGAAIYDLQAKKYLWQATMDPSVIGLVEFIRERFPEVGLEICGFDYNRCEVINDVMAEHLRLEALPAVICRYENFGAPVCKLLLTDRAHRIPNVIEALQAHPLRDQFDFVRSTSEYYEILPKGASKGNVMLRLADLLGVDHSCVYAVGDNENDISMLQRAAVGYAVANAAEAAKKAADVVLESTCNESAVAELIHRL